MLMSNMGGKLAILAVVPKALAGKLSAKAWSSKVRRAFHHAMHCWAAFACTLYIRS